MALTSAAEETRLTQEFKRFIAAGGPLAKLRVDAFEYFRGHGFPTPRLEEWKYTNIAAIAREDWVVNDSGLEMSEIDEDFLKLLPDFCLDRNGLAALNLGLGEIVCIRIPKDT